MTAPFSSGLPVGSFAVDPAAIPYGEAARDGRLVLPFCVACAASFWYPRGFCPRCGGEDLRWRPSTGRGRIHTSTIVRRAGGEWSVHVPFCVAVVVLDQEGVAITANIVDALSEQIAPGEEVIATFEGGAGALPALRFRPYRGDE